MADGECRGREVVAHGPDGESGAVEEGDETAGFLTPAGEEAVEFIVGSWHDPFLAFPGWVLKVHDDDVGYFAKIDWVAEDGFAWVAVNATSRESGGAGIRRTWSAQKH